MKRLKILWDEIHPEFNEFSEKHLREHACYVVKKNLVLKNNHDNQQHSNEQYINDQLNVQNDRIC